MTGERSVSVGRDAIGNFIFTGDFSPPGDVNLAVHQHLNTPASAGPVDVAAILAAFEDASSELLHWPRTLHGGQALARPELETLRQRLRTDESRITMLLGPPGSGKSALLRELAESLRSDGVSVLAIKADSIPAETETPEALRSWLGLPVSADACLSAMASTGPCVLIVDQLDALCEIVDIRTRRLDLLTRLVRQAAAHPAVRVVLSCREFESRHDARFERLDAEPLRLDLPTWEVVGPILA